MEIKKTEKASLKGRNLLFFLLGLNVILLAIWGLFSYHTYDYVPVIEEEEPQEILTEAIVIDIPEPETPPPPPKADEPPPPPPPEVPMEIEESPEPVEPPEIKEVEITPPTIETTTTNTGPRKKVDLSGLKTKTNDAPKEERESEPVTINRVKNMAVYPGCEKFKGNKAKLSQCFSKELTKDVIQFLDAEYPEEAEDKPRVQVLMKFHVSKDGKLTNITPDRGDAVFKPEGKRALEKVASWLDRKNKKIEPATMANGEKATLIFQVPLVLQNPEM